METSHRLTLFVVDGRGALVVRELVVCREETKASVAAIEALIMTAAMGSAVSSPHTTKACTPHHGVHATHQQHGC